MALTFTKQNQDDKSKQTIKAKIEVTKKDGFVLDGQTLEFYATIDDGFLFLLTIEGKKYIFDTYGNLKQ